jgi:hypothetical protein
MCLSAGQNQAPIGAKALTEEGHDASTILAGTTSRFAPTTRAIRTSQYDSPDLLSQTESYLSAIRCATNKGGSGSGPRVVTHMTVQPAN